MKESFYDSPSLSKESLKPLLKRKNAPGIIRFLIQYGIFVLSAWGIVFFSDKEIWFWVISLLTNGLMVLSLFAITHESGHYTAFKAKSLNKIVLWIASASHFYTPTGFRQLHFAHHRHTHDPNLDPEISIGGKPAPAIYLNLPFYLGFLSGLPILMFKILMLLSASFGPSMIWEKVMPFCVASARNRLRWEARLVLALYAGILAAGILWIPALLWLFLAQLIGHSFLAMYTSAEHTGLPHEGSIMDKTRSIQTNGLVKFLVWNMPFHAEHHAFPAVPFHALPVLHEKLKPELKHTVSGYPSFQKRMIKGILNGKGWVENEIQGKTHAGQKTPKNSKKD